MPELLRRLLCIAASVTAATLHAQDRDAELKPVTVVGADSAPVQERTELGTLTPETPLAGEVIEREALELVRPADPLRELLSRVPGVSMLRNLRIPEPGKGYTEGLVDGYQMKSATLGTTSFLNEVNLWDVERVEVTRGPGSVLHSSRAIGGILNVVTREPGAQPETKLWGEAGSYGFARIGAHTMGRLDAGAGYVLNANAMDNGGWRTRSAERRENASAKLLLSPDADSRLTLRAEKVAEYREFPGQLTEAQFEGDWRQAARPNLYSDVEFDTYAATYKRLVGERGELDLGFAERSTEGVDGCPSGCSVPALSATRETQLDYRDRNVRAMYRHDFEFAKSRLYVGIHRFTSDKRDDTYNRAANTFTRTTLNNAFTVMEENTAPFAQVEFSPLERLRVALGARRESYELDSDDRSPASNRDGSKRFSKLVRKAGITYDLATDGVLWASAAEGFYVPSTTATISGANAKPELPPERSVTHQVGLRGAWPSLKLSYDIDLYRTVIRDLTVSQSCNGSRVLCPDAFGAGATYPSVARKVRFNGLEAALGYRPLEVLGFDLAYTRARNRLVEYVDPGGDFSGNTYAASPQHHLNLRATVRPAPAWTAELTLDHISRYFTNSRNNDTYRRPDLYHLRIAHAWGSWSAWAHLLNVFDERYAERISATNTAAPVRTYHEGYLPRTLRLGVSWEL